MSGLFGGNSPMTFPPPAPPQPPPLPTGWNWVTGSEGVRGTAPPVGPGPFPFGGRGGPGILPGSGPYYAAGTRTTLGGGAGTKTAGYG
jgi:hypothetical protein